MLVVASGDGQLYADRFNFQETSVGNQDPDELTQTATAEFELTIGAAVERALTATAEFEMAVDAAVERALTATAQANPPQSNPATESSPLHVNVTPEPRSVTAGDTVVFTFAVEGDPHLDFADVIVTNDACDNSPTLTEGDENENSILDDEEIWLFSCEVTNVTERFTSETLVEATQGETPVGDSVITQVNVLRLQNSFNVALDMEPDSDLEIAFSGSGDVGDFTLMDDGIEPESGFEAQINFQPEEVSDAFDDYEVDSGEPYGERDNGLTYGWISEDSIANPDDATPVDMTSEVRERMREGIDPLRDTLIHMQRPSDSATHGVWEIALPSGRYIVTVSVGDQPPYDSRHTINVEGVTAIADFESSSGNEYREATVTVDVNDENLTIDAFGGVNTKLNYIRIVELAEQANIRRFYDLPFGNYETIATIPEDWSLSDVDCDDDSDAIDGGVRIALGVDDSITCTFHIELDEASNSESEIQGTINSLTSANIRSGPGSRYDVIAMVETGEQVVVLGTDDSEAWVNIRLNDGTEGWIAALLVTLDE
jgi:hypothetical protein